MKDFNADNLLRQLGKLNAEAFPQVAHILENKDGSVYVLKPIHPKAEIRDLICDLYAKCGDKLHTGSLKSILRKRDKTYDITYLRSALDGLNRLLAEHVVFVPNGKAIHAKMHFDSGDGRVRCRWLDASLLSKSQRPNSE